MISELLREFIAKADTHVVGEPPYGSAKEIIERNLGEAKFLGLDVKASFGMGRATAVPWIAFIGYGQRTEEGVYPVYLYFKAQKRLVLAYGVSETHPPSQNWTGIDEKQTIKEFFNENGLGTPNRYGSSFVQAVYDTNENFDENRLLDDLNTVINRFHSTFENRKTNLEDSDFEETGELRSRISEALKSRECVNLLNMEEFVFEKAQEKLHELDEFNISPDELRRVLTEFNTSQSTFTQHLPELDAGSQQFKILRLIGELVSYCDKNAANKKEYNGYPDFRTLARSGVRQPSWVKNLLEYKLNNKSTSGMTPSIRNAINYLKDPANELTMLSENHRKMVSDKLLRKASYDKNAFVSEVKALFEPFHVRPVNPLNLTRILSNVLYQPPIKELWYEASEDSIENERVEYLDHTIKIKSISFQDELRPIITAIKTKPFVLFAGLSGTGKSRLVRTLAYQTCTDPELRMDSRKPGNFELIPVRPNWHDSSQLIGYVSRVNGERYIITSFIRFLVKAWKYPEVPFFLCLDEMNLAPVEQYFAEYLSVIETRANHNGKLVTDYLIAKDSFERREVYEQMLRDLGAENQEVFRYGISIPSNLIVVGTVNMDETTHSFSRKVLDRAMTIEMNTVDLRAGLDGEHSDWSFPEDFISSDEVIGRISKGSEVAQGYRESEQVLEFLQRINGILEGTPFKVAYRVRDEFLIYCYYSSLLADRPENWLDVALDEITAMKLLSRIEGDEAKTGELLSEFERVINGNFPQTTAKLNEMRQRLQLSGYTSFWS